MNERASTTRVIVTLAVSAAVVVAVILAIAAFASFAVGPVAGDEPAETTPTPIAVEPELTTTPVPEPPLPVVPAAAVAATPAPVTRSEPALSGYVVVIDPGHQAKADLTGEPIGPGSSKKKPRVAGGATGTSSGTPESRINLDVALKLERELEAKGVKVFMTRTKQDVNIANSARAKIANEADADLFIRLHCDHNSSHSVHGLSTLKPARNQWTGPIVEESGKGAKRVHAAVLSSTGASDRGVVPRSDMSGFNWSEVPSVIVEMGFLSNPTEDRKLNTDSYQRKLAAGLSAGVVDYLETRQP